MPGASVTPGTTKWTWLSGADFLYTYWSANEPSHNDDTTHIQIGPTGAWISSSGSAGFICEWDK